MTKKELIEKLNDYPDNMLIIMPGHSDGQGYNDVYDITETLVEDMTNDHDWAGRYFETTNPDNKIKAILIN